ncbi:MAG: TonB-dependent receptor, partial [Kangiellaceae bacterium]|nr:TonB-dependent receptor [Kangiellaceae bacterium]
MKLVFVTQTLLGIFILSLAFPQPLKANDINLLDLTLEELLEFKIESAGKRPEKIKEIPASVIIITREDIASYGYTSLTDVLEQVPGFYNIYSYEGVSGNFGIRGFWNPRSQNSNVAILVNGVNQAREDIRSNPLAKITVPVEAIDRIEVIRGPMSVMYGNGASFGVINIITNNAGHLGENDMVGLNLSIGDFQKKKVSIRYEKEKNDITVVANFGLYSANPIDALLIDMIDESKVPTLPFLGVENPQTYSFDDKLELDSRYLDISISNKRWLVDISYNWSEVEKFLLLPPVTDGTLEGNENKMFHLSYRDSFNRNNDYSIDYTYNDYFRDQDFDALTPDLEGYNFVEYKSHSLEFILNTQLTDSVSLTTGL